MYEIPKQKEIIFSVDEDGSVELTDDIVIKIDKNDYRDFIKAYASINLISKYADDMVTLLDAKPITVKSTGDTIIITQTGRGSVLLPYARRN